MLTMSPRASSATHNFRVVLHLLRASKFESNNGRFHRNSVIMSEYSKLGSGYWIHPGKQFYTTNRSNTTSDPTGVKNANDEPQVPSSSSSFSLTNWLRWVLNSVLYLLLPLWRNWQKLRIEGKGEEVMDEVEKVAELVEKVANVAEEVAENVAENLPEDSDFRKVALVVESVSKQAAHDAHLIDQFIDKADEVKNDLDDLGSFVESITDNIAKEKSEEK